MLSSLRLLQNRSIQSGVRAFSITKDQLIQKNEWNNITPAIANKVGLNIYKNPLNPICILKKSILSFFNDQYKNEFQVFEDFSPIVTTKQAFDDILIPKDHVSRRKSDTYYVDATHVLRPHTSAHQVELLAKGIKSFIVVGDTYRRDEVNRTHYPVFTQMEIVRTLPESNPDRIVDDMKGVVEGLIHYILGDYEHRWIDGYFPFTNPSLEVEVNYNGKWMELLGSGAIEPQVLANAGRPNDHGWALGIGLERLAMSMFRIPDIRLFWLTDKRFLGQFESVKEGIRPGVVPPVFQELSKFPACYKDVSFFLPKGMKQESFNFTDMCEIIRNESGDLAEDVELIDAFYNPKKDRQSLCYRISYRSHERNLLNSEIDAIQLRVRESLAKTLGVELR
ncbi:hypothetical protein WA538_005917, partial [Blastocystis sp. DL]